MVPRRGPGSPRSARAGPSQGTGFPPAQMCGKTGIWVLQCRSVSASSAGWHPAQREQGRRRGPGATARSCKRGSRSCSPCEGRRPAPPGLAALAGGTRHWCQHRPRDGAVAAAVRPGTRCRHTRHHRGLAGASEGQLPPHQPPGHGGSGHTAAAAAPRRSCRRGYACPSEPSPVRAASSRFACPLPPPSVTGHRPPPARASSSLGRAPAAPTRCRGPDPPAPRPLLAAVPPRSRSPAGRAASVRVYFRVHPSDKLSALVPSKNLSEHLGKRSNSTHSASQRVTQEKLKCGHFGGVTRSYDKNGDRRRS